MLLLNIPNYYDNYEFSNVAAIPTTFETATVFYDSKTRPIRSYETNYLGGYTTTDSKWIL